MTATADRVEIHVPHGKRWDRGLAAVPVATATGLGLLYAVGAIVKTTQLLGADVPVREALALVPLQQLLQVGIGTAVQYAFGLGTVAVVVYAVGFTLAKQYKPLHISLAAGEWPSTLEVLPRPIRGIARRLTLSLIGRILLFLAAVLLLILLLLTSLLFVPWIVTALWLALAPMFVLLIARRARVHQDPYSPRAFAALVATGCTLILLAGEYLNPQPLSLVRVWTTSGVIQGRLVAVTADSVVLSSRRDSLQVIPRDQAKSVRIDRVPREDRLPTLYDVLADD